MLTARKSVDALNFTGGLVSCLCIVHCLLLPFVVFMLPAGLSGVMDESIHKILLGLGLLVSGPILWGKGNLSTRTLGLVGFTLLAIGLGMSEEIHERVVTSVGSLLIVSAHVIRHVKCRCC